MEAGHRQTLGPRHPVMADAQQQLRDARRALADEMRRTLEAARAELAQAEAAEAAAARRASAQTSPDAAAARLRALESEVDATRAAYEKALRPRSGADDQDASVRLLAPATAEAAARSPELAQALALGGGAGAALGLLSALAGLRGRGRAPAPRTDVRESLTAPAAPAPAPDLTAAPSSARFSAPPQPEPHAADDAGALVAETDGPGLAEVVDAPGTAYAIAVNALEASIREEAAGAETYTVLVTSLAPRSGKSTLAANLARAAAAEGRRVLLVDAHPGNPTLSLAFGLGQEPGLIRFGGRDRPVQALDGNWSEGLFFIPVDTAQNGVTPMLPPGAERRFDGLSGQFDLVVIDGPPAGVEPTDAALAATADQVLLVSPPDAQADPAWASALLAVPRDKVRELPMAA